MNLFFGVGEITLSSYNQWTIQINVQWQGALPALPPHPLIPDHCPVYCPCGEWPVQWRRAAEALSSHNNDSQMLLDTFIHYSTSSCCCHGQKRLYFEDEDKYRRLPGSWSVGPSTVWHCALKRWVPTGGQWVHLVLQIAEVILHRSTPCDKHVSDISLALSWYNGLLFAIYYATSSQVVPSRHPRTCQSCFVKLICVFVSSYLHRISNRRLDRRALLPSCSATEMAAQTGSSGSRASHLPHTTPVVYNTFNYHGSVSDDTARGLQCICTR